MGCGPGPGRGIPLSEYQEEVGDTVMTVSGNDYTFVANHTISAGVEIIFGINDTLTINTDVAVTLEGKLNITEETVNGIVRITVNGIFSMVECSEIEFGNITQSLEVISSGISVSSTGVFNQNGGDISITTVDGAPGITVGGITVGGTFTSSAGTIQIGTVSNGGIGIYLLLGGDFIQAGGDITFGQLQTSATAIRIESDLLNSTFTKQNGATIRITIPPPVGGGTSGMVVTAGSVVTNLGGNSSIDMTNSDTPYTPALTPADPLAAPWNGAGSFRAFYAP